MVYHTVQRAFLTSWIYGMVHVLFKVLRFAVFLWSCQVMCIFWQPWDCDTITNTASVPHPCVNANSSMPQVHCMRYCLIYKPLSVSAVSQWEFYTCTHCTLLLGCCCDAHLTTVKCTAPYSLAVPAMAWCEHAYDGSGFPWLRITLHVHVTGGHHTPTIRPSLLAQSCVSWLQVQTWWPGACTVFCARFRGYVL
jgi:hypothetical protein